MRDLDPQLAAHLAGETTTCCRCWRAIRRDGMVLGFTDHDEDLAFDGTIFRAASGLDAAEASAEFGFAVGGGEVAGVLGDASLTEADLAAGSWDQAKVEMFLVNWSAPEQRVRLRVAEIGEVRRSGSAFSAELRSMMHRLDARTGRLYAMTCDAELGDARCRKDLNDPAFRGTGAVLEAVSAFELTAMGLDRFADGWFNAGTLRFASGPNAGTSHEVREHRAEPAGARLALWQKLPFSPQPGDVFTLEAGCDKRLETCRDRFANAANFRGFPHIPGTERVLGYPSAEDGEHDGGSYFL
ncbi:DUF2163 domain-containing protein [Terrihabitans sp. B22-R8]|uniref:DUF2163 domain-containing protein n=1 Tax=Terrihabitans sp. B22-R8 TaxID=3425128 RepID=UPI00403C951D